MLKDRRVLLFAVLYFTMVVNVYGLSFWVGEIVDKINGVGDVGKGFVTAIPYAVAIVGMVVIPRYSDRTGERKRVVSACLAVAAAALRGSHGRLAGRGDRRARRRPVLPARRPRRASGRCRPRCSSGAAAAAGIA